MEETLIKTNIPVLKRMVKIIHSGRLPMPFGESPKKAKLEKVCANYSMNEYWYTISMGDWQYFTPNQMQIVDLIKPDIDDQTLFIITMLIAKQNMPKEQSISIDKLYKLVKNLA